MSYPKFLQGFSLVELLITLAIMGILAVFTIPPLFQMPASNQPAKYTAIAKDTAFMVLTAYEAYKAANPTVATTVSMGALTPYMNYVAIDTSSVMNDAGAGTWTCSSSYPCLRLHNGGSLNYLANLSFGGNTTQHAIYFRFEPDSRLNNISALPMLLFYPGNISTDGSYHAYTCNSGGCTTTTSGADPTWFSGF